MPGSWLPALLESGSSRVFSFVLRLQARLACTCPLARPGSGRTAALFFTTRHLTRSLASRRTTRPLRSAIQQTHPEDSTESRMTEDVGRAFLYRPPELPSTMNEQSGALAELLTARFRFTLVKALIIPSAQVGMTPFRSSNNALGRPQHATSQLLQAASGRELTLTRDG